jgi:hypothetical protein
MISAMRAWIARIAVTLRAVVLGPRARQLRHASRCGLAAID